LFQITLLQNRNTISIGDKIIDYLHLFERDYLLKRLNIYPPWKVGGNDDFLCDRSGNTKAGGGDFSLSSQEFL